MSEKISLDSSVCLYLYHHSELNQTVVTSSISSWGGGGKLIRKRVVQTKSIENENIL